MISVRSRNYVKGYTMPVLNIFFVIYCDVTTVRNDNHVGVNGYRLAKKQVSTTVHATSLNPTKAYFHWKSSTSECFIVQADSVLICRFGKRPF